MNTILNTTGPTNIRIDTVHGCDDPDAASAISHLLYKAFPAMMRGGREAAIGYLGNFPIGIRGDLDDASDAQVASVATSYLVLNHLPDMIDDDDWEELSDPIRDVICPPDEIGHIIDASIVDTTSIGEGIRQ